MSAFMVSEKCFRAALAAMIAADITIDGQRTSKMDCATLDRLGQRMLAANVEALGERYGKEAAAEAYLSAVGYSLNPALKTPKVQQLKSLQCMSYQCCEGYVHETAIYRLMTEAEGGLAQDVIRDLPEYKEASWD